ncbi:MAG: exodeoxyribonuclease VII large subunit [Oscillospiraceae bacterium]|jgi:exodeoxyribonuclease VII large subunit|nr:exodeoxyribonuclease VII large subunit [Oscillospiraceae bacterium]
MEAITVTQLNTYAKSVLDGDKQLQDVLLQGEVSGFKIYPSGHWYFTLKDEKAAISACMWSSSAKRLKFRPKDGDDVIVRGRVSIYETKGTFQILCTDMQPAGVGALWAAYEQLREKLQKQGLFDKSRKRELPQYPTHIGVVTSEAGAAFQDIRNVLGRRWPVAKITLASCAVQGPGAAEEIAEGIRRLNSLPDKPDVLIVGRGGGSMEDLWAFNEEVVAWAAARSQIPVISAVGHETDFSILDFVSDVRAPTPSAAAELASPDAAEILAYLRTRQTQLGLYTQQVLQQKKRALLHLTSRSVLRRPEAFLDKPRQRLDYLTAKLSGAFAGHIHREKARLAEVAGKLDALSPLKVLQRGYSIAEKDGSVLRSVKDVRIADKISVRLTDGAFFARVLETE